MRFFAILFLVIIVWYAYQMFRDIVRGSSGVGKGSKEVRQEGDVTIRKTSRQPQKRVRDDVGEYVDFKEVKERK